MSKNMTKMMRFPERAKILGRSRKAQAETQLNWIFILIVGMVILAFFTFIVVKQRAASEAKFAGKVSQQLNTILVGAKVASGTVQTIPTPELEIRFTCNDYYIGPASQRLGNRIVFAPEYVEGNQLITWTLDWNVPYKVTSLLYMTTPMVRYVIIGPSADDSQATRIFDSLPAKLNKHIFSISDYNAGMIREENDKYVRFIFVNTGEAFNIPLGFEDVELSGLVVDTTNNNVQFLVKSETGLITSGQKFTYVEPEILYGAVFTDRYQEYDCLMRRAYDRLNIVSYVYIEKLNELAPIYDRTNCDGFYRNNRELSNMTAATDNYPPNYASIADTKTALEGVNTKLQLYSCPLIY